MPTVQVFTHQSLESLGLYFVQCTLKNSDSRGLQTDNDFFNTEEIKFEAVRRLYITQYSDGSGNDRGGILNKERKGDVLQKAVGGPKDTNYFFMATAKPSHQITPTKLTSENFKKPSEKRVAFLRMLQIIGQEKLVNCETCCSFRTNLLTLLNV